MRSLAAARATLTAALSEFEYNARYAETDDYLMKETAQHVSGYWSLRFLQLERGNLKRPFTLEQIRDSFSRRFEFVREMEERIRTAHEIAVSKFKSLQPDLPFASSEPDSLAKQWRDRVRSATPDLIAGRYSWADACEKDFRNLMRPERVHGLPQSPRHPTPEKFAGGRTSNAVCALCQNRVHETCRLRLDPPSQQQCPKFIARREVHGLTVHEVMDREG